MTNIQLSHSCYFLTQIRLDTCIPARSIGFQLQCFKKTPQQAIPIFGKAHIFGLSSLRPQLSQLICILQNICYTIRRKSTQILCHVISNKSRHRLHTEWQISISESAIEDIHVAQSSIRAYKNSGQK
eukprot:Gregarina_sp_Pseudo_9__237@NODE_1152_length_1831_cov_9_377790_g1078_i0_p3_GENE_NODE_1152_length_1831_cov_9_377790_g1078_i0NODE_1152_length_1831_cov_9_377790_g1078_i0_p3_ORF_typecomplete_len127_score1_87DUF29/PF01724_16/0_23_NODE_1152_length_1831_cov_9_377790_g1078_i0321701